MPKKRYEWYYDFLAGFINIIGLKGLLQRYEVTWIDNIDLLSFNAGHSSL